MSMECVLSTVEVASSLALAVSVPLWLVVEGYVHHRAESRRQAPTAACSAAMATSAAARGTTNGVQTGFSRAHIMWLPSNPHSAAVDTTPDGDRLSGTRRG